LELVLQDFLPLVSAPGALPYVLLTVVFIGTTYKTVRFKVGPQGVELVLER
jgi:hypothetical protein